ncbi:MAG: 1-acyl-sn-glycerol-3-phosphate acyltransferase [Bacteroidia bacterium]|nr:1-acyl-sn-glycerol-3-phosphate acyltransferase [Bacteroidia bacterium]
MENELKVPKIDVDKVFKEKNPTLYKFMPRFIISFIKWILHQRDINSLLSRGKGLNGIEFSEFVLKDLGITIKYKGIENVPESGNVIIASNHPLGGIDGIALINMMGKVRSDLKFIVNDILYQIPNYEGMFIPVNKHGVNPKSSLETIEKIYASQEAVLIFPAGLCSRKIKGKVIDIEWNKSFINKSLKYNSPVVPILINAKNSKLFYNIATFRKSLGLKINIEMFLLPREMFRQKGKTFEIIIGKPIPSLAFKEGKSEKWARKIRHFIYEFRNNPQIDFNDFLNKKRN